MNTKHKHYDEAFKKSAVEHWLVSGKSARQVAADGCKLVATTYGGGIWSLQNPPTPQLHIAPTDHNFELSWIVPSAGFVLQHSRDLQNWTNRNDLPLINLANLQNEVTLSPTNGSGFYRLKTP